MQINYNLIFNGYQSGLNFILRAQLLHTQPWQQTVPSTGTLDKYSHQWEKSQQVLPLCHEVYFYYVFLAVFFIALAVIKDWLIQVYVQHSEKLFWSPGCTRLVAGLRGEAYFKNQYNFFCGSCITPNQGTTLHDKAIKSDSTKRTVILEITIDLKQLQIQCISLIINTMDLKNEKLAYIFLRKYLSHTHENHTAQKFQNEQGKPRIKCLHTNNRTPLTATNIQFVLLPLKQTKLQCVEEQLFLSHTQSTEEFRFKMNKGLPDLAFPLFFLQLFLLQNKKNLLVALRLMLDVQMCTRIITIGIQCSSADWISLSK